MRLAFHFTSLGLLLTFAACGERRISMSDLGPTDTGVVMDSRTADAPATDSAVTDAGSTTDAPVHDAGPPDIGGEACGSSVCATGSYCCAASCNLCLPNAMFCLSDPCAGIDAGPRDAGPPHDAGSACGATFCTPGTVCMSCRTPFGITMTCLPVGSVC